MRSYSQGGLLRALLIVLLVMSLSGCGLLAKLFKRDKEKDERDPVAEKKEEAAPVRVVGEVASTHPAEGFVLIRRYAQGVFGEAPLLAAMGEDGRSASLRLTGEKLGRYYAADIQEGTPQKGDLIVARSLPKTSIAPSTPVSEAPKSDGNAPWAKNFPNP